MADLDFSMQTLLIHALRSEAGILRQYFPLAKSPVCDLGIELRHLTDHLHLLRTGVGMQATQEVLSKLPNPRAYGQIIHFGVSGSVADNLPMQALIQGVAFKADDQPLLEPNLVHLPDELEVKPVTFFCVHDPVDTDIRRSEILRQEAQVVDMESYPVAQFAMEYDIPLLALRAISDRANDSMEVDFKRHYATAAKTLQSFMLDNLIKG